MDEERFLKHTLGQYVEVKQEKFTDFSDIMVPEVLKRPPTFDFMVQVKALYLR